MTESNLIFISIDELKAQLRSGEFSHRKLISLLEQVDRIFYNSSSKTNFASETEKKEFHYKYLGYYLEKFPSLFLIAVEGISGNSPEVLGYICGAPDTNHCNDLFEYHPYLKTFTEDYKDYPSHLHINCHENSRGKGVGSRLLDKFESKLDNQSKGVHLITSPEARNVGFYKKNGYTYSHQLKFKNSDLLLLGKTI